MTRDLTVVVFIDGWTVVNQYPIVNIIMGVRSLHTLCLSIPQGRTDVLFYIDM